MADYSYKGLMDIFTAPARGMTAMPPAQNPNALAPQGSIGNWLMRAHNALDPVQAMGGYGNLAAMALPPGAPRPPVRAYKGMPAVDLDGAPTQFNRIERPSEFPAFNGSEPGVKIGGFYSESPSVASKFAEIYGGGKGKTGAVYPVDISFKRPYTIDAKGRKAGEIQFGPTGKEFRDAVRSGKYDGVVIKNTADEGNVHVALGKGTVKSAITKKTLFGAAGTAGLGAILGRALMGDRRS